MDDGSITLKDYLAERLDRQDSVLAEIRTEVKATNGRVRSLERAVAVLQVGYLIGAFVCGSLFVAILGKWLG